VTQDPLTQQPLTQQPSTQEPLTQGEIVVDLAAVRHNLGVLQRVVEPATVMLVVKADAYGHGMGECAAAARQAGVTWLGVATIEEGLRLRRAGDQGRVLTWLDLPGADYAEAIAHDLDLTAYSVNELEAIAAAAQGVGTIARVQLKVDTGLSRGGASLASWPALVEAARRLEQDQSVLVTGLWSHFAASDQPSHPANDEQEGRFREALALAERAGLRPEVTHLANSAAAILRPSSRFNLVRCGIAAYGLDPAPGQLPTGLGLIPAMTVRAPLALTKEVPAGGGVSYGHTWIADRDTTVGLVPVGYGDGVPRHASSRAEVWLAGHRRPVRGRICMDQFLVDLGGEQPALGSLVVLFGPGLHGEPTAQDWAQACDTINYEIVTRIGGRLNRRYVGEGAS
jgi:alanine racemase